jgi:hypothetical protein
MGATGATAPGCRLRPSWPSPCRMWDSPVGGTKNERSRRHGHDHRRTRLARHALALFERADGSEAAGTGRDSCSPAHGRRKAQGGSRAARAGKCINYGSSVIGP